MALLAGFRNVRVSEVKESYYTDPAIKTVFPPADCSFFTVLLAEANNGPGFQGSYARLLPREELHAVWLRH